MKSYHLLMSRKLILILTIIFNSCITKESNEFLIGHVNMNRYFNYSLGICFDLIPEIESLNVYDPIQYKFDKFSLSPLVSLSDIESSMQWFILDTKNVKSLTDSGFVNRIVSKFNDQAEKHSITNDSNKIIYTYILPENKWVIFIFVRSDNKNGTILILINQSHKKSLFDDKYFKSIQFNCSSDSSFAM